MANDQAEPSPPPVGTSNKPRELLEMAAVSAELFTKLKSWFDVPDEVTMLLASVAGADVITDLQDGRKVAAFAMRKLQALHLTAQPGVETRADVPITLIDSVVRALVEAPNRHLTLELDSTDWDHEGRLLESGLLWKKSPPPDELPRFNALVMSLCDARATLVEFLDNGNPVLA